MLSKATRYAIEIGCYSEAYEMGSSSLEVEKIGLGANHGQALEEKTQVFGEDRPDTLTSMINLAFTLKSKGFAEKAICLMADCCNVELVVFGPRHPGIVPIREALAMWLVEAVQVNSRKNT